VNSTEALTFLWTPWSMLLSIVIVLVTAGLCILAWRRSGYARGQGVLELLRLTIVILLAVIFNQPEWVEEFRPDEKPSVVVLVDESPSMETRDADLPASSSASRSAVPGAASPGSAGSAGSAATSSDTLTSSGTGSGTAGGQSTRSAQLLTRSDAITPLKDEAAWASLQERMDVSVEPFARSTGEDSHSRTDLAAPLMEAPEKYGNLIGIVLASDGDWNEGQPPVQAATDLRMRGIPVFPVSVGSPTRLPDVELVGLSAPTFGVAGKAVRIPFTIESTLPREYPTTVTLRTSDGDEIPRDIRIAPMGRTSDAFLWKPRGTGDFTLTLEVPQHPDETIPDNNERTAPISIREEKLRVLVVESYPRWEYRYLRNALSRDPGVDVSCLLFHPGLSKVGGGNQDYIRQFPDGLDELSRFDVVFVGGVGLGGRQVTDDDIAAVDDG